MPRPYVSPAYVIGRAIKAGLPEGIEYGANALWTRQGDMLSADLTYNNRSFRWVVTDRDMNDQEFTPSKFKDALAALVALANTPVAAPEPEPTVTQKPVTFTDPLFEELYGSLVAA
jgi:hypothetical protein